MVDTNSSVGFWTLDGQWPMWLLSSVDQITNAWSSYVEHRARWFGATAAPASSISGSLAEVVDQLASAPDSNLLLGTTTGWTASFHHPSVPWFEPGAEAALYALVPCDFARLWLAPDPTAWGAAPDDSRGFTYQAAPRSVEDFRTNYLHTKDGVRVVNLTREDGRWTFSAGGAELPFEEVTAYQRSRRADRLTPDMLSRYAAALDIPVSSPDSYNGQAVLLHRTQRSGQAPPINPETAAAARAELEAIVASRIQTTARPTQTS